MGLFNSPFVAIAYCAITAASIVYAIGTTVFDGRKISIPFNFTKKHNL